MFLYKMRQWVRGHSFAKIKERLKFLLVILELLDKLKWTLPTIYRVARFLLTLIPLIINFVFHF